MSAFPAVSRRVRALLGFSRSPRTREVPFDTATYWEDRYASGGNSGAGSYGAVADFKARVLNNLVATHDLHKVVEFGCGDGHQLSLASYPSYVGFDVSETAIKLCRARFAGDHSKRFVHYDPATFAGVEPDRQADLVLSLEVIFHLIEDDVFERHLEQLFDASRNLVAIFSSDTDQNPPNRAPHFLNRQFTPWVATNRPDFQLIEKISFRPPPGQDGVESVSDFFIFAHRLLAGISKNGG